MRKPTRRQAQAAAVVIATGTAGGAIGAAIGVTINMVAAPSRPTPFQARFASDQAKQRTEMLRAVCDLDKAEKKVRKAAAKVDKAKKADKYDKAQNALEDAWTTYCKAASALDISSGDYTARIMNLAKDLRLDDPFEAAAEQIFKVVSDNLAEWEAAGEKLAEEAQQEPAPAPAPDPEPEPVKEEAVKAPIPMPTAPAPEPAPASEAKPAAPNPVANGGRRHPLTTAPLSKRQQKRIAARERAQRLEAERIAAKAAAAAQHAKDVVGNAPSGEKEAKVA